MKNLFKRLRQAYKIATTKDIIVYTCQPHRCMEDGTIEATSTISMSENIHPRFLEFAYTDCLNSFEDMLDEVIDQDMMEILIQEAKIQLEL